MSLEETEKKKTHRERRLCEDRGTEAVTRVTLSQTKEFQGPAELEEEREESSQELLEEAQSC